MAFYLITLHALNYSNVITIGVAHLKEAIKQMFFFIDFKKAFNTVLHNKLIHKLSNFGIGAKTLGWIKAFLSGRSQLVQINGAYSSCSAVTSGVVQGSVLGPLLLALYINGLPDCCPACVVKLFTDDTKAYDEITSQHDSQVFQKLLCNICIWAECWELDLSYDKCCYLQIGYEDNSLSYRLGQHVLNPVVTRVM